MQTAMTTELYWLVLTTLMTALVFVPYIINAPWLRTPAFAVGVGCQMVLALTLLRAL